MTPQEVEEYIYKLIDPFTHEVRWIGRTTDPEGRLISHLFAKNEGSEKEAWIADLRQRDALPIMEIIEKVTSGHPLQHERHWIQVYLAQGAPLFNKVHNKKKYSIVGFDQGQQRHKQQAAWLYRLLAHFSDELSTTDKLVWLTLYAMCDGQEQPQQIQLKQLIELSGITHHSLTDVSERNLGSLQRLHCLGLITYNRVNTFKHIVTVHVSRIEPRGEATL